jgi:hypothetical protein
MSEPSFFAKAIEPNTNEKQTNAVVNFINPPKVETSA